MTPTAFTRPPSAQELLAAINANGAQVERLQAHGARLSIPGVPSLRTSLALERPLRLRMQAGLGLTGTELDLGSNDELFWMWAKRNDPNGIFFARHADFDQSAANQILPIPPAWLIETLGLVQIDQNATLAGPYSRDDGQVEIRATVTTANGALTKVFVIDDRSGVLLQQQVYDPSGQMIASATASQHTYDATYNVTLPRVVKIQIPPAGMVFTLEVDNYTVNGAIPNSQQLFSVPQLPGAQMVPLASRPPQAAGNRVAGWQSGNEFMARSLQ